MVKYTEKDVLEFCDKMNSGAKTWYQLLEYIKSHEKEFEIFLKGAK